MSTTTTMTNSPEPKPVPALSDYQRDLITMGLCPFCQAPIRGYVPRREFVDMNGVYTAEPCKRFRCAFGCGVEGDVPAAIAHNVGCPARETNPKTGHRRWCPHQGITLR